MFVLAWMINQSPQRKCAASANLEIEQNDRLILIASFSLIHQIKCWLSPVSFSHNFLFGEYLIHRANLTQLGQISSDKCQLEWKKKEKLLKLGYLGARVTCDEWTVYCIITNNAFFSENRKIFCQLIAILSKELLLEVNAVAWLLVSAILKSNLKLKSAAEAQSQRS